MVDFLEKEKCCGCSACVNICNFNAISMKSDTEGFLYPEIDQNKCCHCSACERVCPVINQIEKKDKKEPITYAVTSKQEDILLKSSSGGLFLLLASYILAHDGTVFGAAFSSAGDVKHKEAINEKELESLCGSKYVQSDIGQAYRSCRELLAVNKFVLFTGTPCQIAGLNCFLNQQYDNLLTMEVICHGVPSPQVLKRYIKNIEKNKKTKISTISFRNKNTGWENYSVKYQYADGTSETLNHQDDLYNKIFLSNNALRNSCYNCSFKEGKSNADITCGDFWGIENVVPKMASNNGVSLVFCHSDKGERYLNAISSWIQKERVRYEDAVMENPVFLLSVQKPGSRSLFFKDIKRKNIDKCIEYFCSENETVLKKIQFRQDINEVRAERGNIYAFLWMLKNIMKIMR